MYPAPNVLAGYQHSWCPSRRHPERPGVLRLCHRTDAGRARPSYVNLVDLSRAIEVALLPAAARSERQGCFTGRELASCDFGHYPDHGELDVEEAQLR